MHRSQIFLTTIVFCLFFSPLTSQAQEIRENEKGEKIVVYPDGRMEYFNGDPVLDENGKPMRTYPVFNGYIEPLDGDISVNEADLFKIAQRRGQLSAEALELAQQRVQEAESNLEQIKQELSQASKGSVHYANLQKQQKAAQVTLQQSVREVMEAEQMTKNDEELYAKGAYIEAFNKRQRLSQAKEQKNKLIRNAADQSYQQLIPLMDNSIASKKEDLLTRPPHSNCSFDFEGQDPDRNQYRRDVKKELLFTYTDEDLRPYLKEKEYLVCEAYLSSLGGYRFLSLSFTFAYPNAREAYGFIEQNSVLTIKLLNGDYVNLRAGEMDAGSYNTVKQELKYSVYYPIDRGLISLLKNSEVNMLRVFWSSGFEEYPIQQMDFFQKQFECLGD